MRNDSDHEILVTQDGGIPIQMFPNQVWPVHLEAGEHKFIAESEGQEDTTDLVFVEDAIKLGGGSLKQSYISPLSPWVLVTMSDRTYFHNRNTKVEYVEMNLAPEKIEYLSEDILLLYTRNEGYSMYSISESRILETFERTPIYRNNVCIIVENIVENDEKKVQDYIVLGYDGSRRCFPPNAVINDSKGVLYIQGEGMSVSIFSLESLCMVGTFTLRSWSKSDRIIKILENGLCISGLHIYDLGNENFNGEHSANIPQPDALASICSNNRLTDKMIYEARQDYNKVRNGISAADSRELIVMQYNKITAFFIIGNGIYYRLNEFTGHGYSRDTVNSFICQVGSDFKVAIGQYSTIKAVDDHLIVSKQSSIIVINKDNQVSYYDNAIMVETPRGRFIEKAIAGTGNSLLSLDGKIIISGYTSYIQLGNGYTNIDILREYGWVKIDDDNKLVEALNVDRFISLNGPVSRVDNALLIKNEASTSYEVILPNVSTTMFPCEEIHAVASDGSFVVYKEKIQDPNITALSIGEIVRCGESFVRTPILRKIYDSDKYRNVLFTADGDHIVYFDARGGFFSLGLSGNDVVKYENEKFIQHVNGYRAEVMLHGAKPRVINPVSGQYLSEAELTQYSFSSPDGSLSIKKPDRSNRASDCMGMLEYIRVHDGSKMTEEEYWRLCQEYNLPPLQDADEDMMLKRISFMKVHSTLYSKAVNNAIAGAKRWQDITVSPTDILYYRPSTDRVSSRSKIDTAIEYFAEFTNDFIRYVAKRIEYIIVRDNQTGVETRIDIGTPLWFLNYISFSFDKRYISIVGRYPDYTISDDGIRIGGLFLLYDLAEKRVVDMSTSTNAVWVSAFTQDGHIGYYDSTPITFLKKNADSVPEQIVGRNFLTFSQSGKYFALSNQGYVRVGHEKEGQVYGHQPSTNIYIRRIDAGYPEVARYSDHGDAISNTRSRSVCMVAFSRNDKHLLSVSDDGVAVIRNLHLD